MRRLQRDARTAERAAGAAFGTLDYPARLRAMVDADRALLHYLRHVSPRWQETAPVVEEDEPEYEEPPPSFVPDDPHEAWPELAYG